jgi:cytochrome c peroxidase
MKHVHIWMGLIVALPLGCERARPYNPRAGQAPLDRPVPVSNTRIPQDWVWQDLGRNPWEKDRALTFVTIEADPELWASLKSFWNESDKLSDPIRIKVPRGLDDPAGFVPPTNPPTLSKWNLGRELFYDSTWLDDSGQLTCARCHDPQQGFSDGRRQSAWGLNAPTLVNVVYARNLFHDGRASYLEETVQQYPEDERVDRPHAWSGVVQRLRESTRWTKRFREVFDTEPTQDAVGQAIATYVRTLLSGDSLVDRARGLAGGAAPEAKHFDPLLDEAALRSVERPMAAKAIVAADLARAWTLYHGPAGCSACHPTGNGYFSDGRFHNIGIDGAGEVWSEAERQGRFRVAPLGEKNRHLIGAWKTPSLRHLSRTGPYFHNGEEPDLRSAIARHVQPDPPGTPRNYYLAPKLADRRGNRYAFNLGDDDLLALTTLLRAMEGQAVDKAITGPADRAAK